MVKRVMKYNPSFLTAEELIENFVVRHTDLDLIIGIIRENVTDANQHVLVIGPRGSGKTTLVLRAAAEIERDKELGSRWYPLVFAEESYEVVSAGEFWLEALHHLGEQTGDIKWKRTYQELKGETDDQRLAERALGQLMDFADTQDKKIMLIVENLNMLFDDLTSEDEAWKMRHALINEPRLMLLATATTKFENTNDLETLRQRTAKSGPTAENRFLKFGDDSHAMYELFKMHELLPLNDRECNAIWEMITGSKLPGDQIKPLRILTGGNPRLITIIAKFGARRSFRRLLDDLVDLVDDHTEYFKSQLESLPTTERKVYLALAGLWNTSTARDIAKAARLDVNKTSSLLNRLISRGFVVIEDQRKKTKWYMVAERMYNIYYLMRRRGKPADRIKAAVKFMVSLYDPIEVAKLIIEEASGLLPDLQREHCMAYEVMIKEISDPQLREEIIAIAPKPFMASLHLDEPVRGLAAFHLNGAKQVELVKEVDFELTQARELFQKGFKDTSEGKHEEAIEKYNEFIFQFRNATNMEMKQGMVTALINKGYCLSELNRMEEAIQVYDEIIAVYGELSHPQIEETIVKAMFNKGATLSKLKRREEAIRTFDELIAVYKNRPEPQVAIQVARSLKNKGVILALLNRRTEGVQTYNTLIAMYQDRVEPEIIEQVVMAMIDKGISYGMLNRMEEAMRVYNEVIRTYKERSETVIVEQVANAMVNQGTVFAALNRIGEAMQAYDEVITAYKDRSEPQISQKAAIALFNRGVLFERSGKNEEAEKCYLEAKTLFPDFILAAVQLIGLRLKIPEKRGGILQTAEDIISKRPEDSNLINGISWIFYKHGNLELLRKAEEWMRQAVSLSPDDTAMHHTLACILSALGKGGEALESAKKYVQDSALVEKSIEDAITLFVELAASGHTKEALGILENSPAEKHLEPLVVGLKLFIGEEVKTAVEILEVAKDVVKRIKDRQVKIGAH